MSSLRITIDTDNAAFEDYGQFPELARILRELATDLEHSAIPVSLRDSNGNHCGTVEVIP